MAINPASITLRMCLHGSPRSARVQTKSEHVHSIPWQVAATLSVVPLSLTSVTDCSLSSPLTLCEV